METINDINEILISAHSARHSFIYNFLAVFTLHLTTIFLTSHYDKVCSCDLRVNVLNRKFVQEMRRLKRRIEEMNTQIYNPVGLNILWPRNVAFLFVRVFIASVDPGPCAQQYCSSPVACYQQLEIEYYVGLLCAVGGVLSCARSLTPLVPSDHLNIDTRQHQINYLLYIIPPMLSVHLE